MSFAHEEIIEGLEIDFKVLPLNIRKEINKVNNAKRLATRPEKIVELEDISEIIANDISEWYDENYEEEDEEEEEEDSSEEEKRLEQERLEAERLENTTPPNVVSHVVNNEVEEEKEVEHAEEKPNSGWGINTSW